jgi:acyl-coenzyme A synthetase/AMP-(fatty) acid ligase
VTDRALNVLLAADTDHVVSFEQDGRERRWSELVALAAGVRAQLERRAGRRWALELASSFEFAAALLGCWSAGKTAVLAPAALLRSSNEAVGVDGVLRTDRPDEPTDTPGRESLQLAEVAPSSSGLSPIPASADLTLYTSGSTGRPKEVSRELGNLEAELAVLESLWGRRLGRCSVYSTVSHGHVYGLLFRVLWPLVERRPFAAFDHGFPEQLVDERGAGHALIASPAILKRLGHLPDRAKWSAVFSSGGLLPSEAAADARRVLGACPVEVLGSTETSGIAWREQLVPDTRWAPMSRVEARVDADGYLTVRSPFSGQADWLRSGDMASFAADGTFMLLGRGDHVAKIEDKRVSLAQIERLLLEDSHVEDVAAVALTDGARQFVGVVLELTELGTQTLERLGKRAFGELVRDSLKGKIDSVALPRKLRYVAQIPVNAQGKRQSAAIRQLFE